MDTDIKSDSEFASQKYFKRNRVQNVRRYFREYCVNTSIHGCNYLSERRSVCERVLWVILILSSFAVCIFLITRIYNKYDQSPVIVSFATEESPIYTIPFPAVTICPMAVSDKRIFNFTKVYHAKEDNETLTEEEELIGQYMSIVCDRGAGYFPPNKTFTEEFFEYIDKVKVSNKIFLQCKFLGSIFRCEDIFKPIIVDEGICYTFNMLGRNYIYKDNVIHFGDYHMEIFTSRWNIDEGYKESGIDSYPVRALLSGADNALQVTLLQVHRDLDYICVEDVQGYSVALHVPHTIPLLKKHYFQVPLDNAVLAAIQPKMMTTSKEVKKYDPKVRNCYFSNERFLKYFKIYTPDNCRLECLANFTLEQCGCVNFYMPRDNSTPVCGNGNMMCMKKSERMLKEIELSTLVGSADDEEDYDDDDDDYYDYTVSCDCIPLCTDLSYDIEQSQTYWDWKENFRAARMPIESGNHIHCSRLSVFFKFEHFLTSQRNELYGPIDFLANFGGLLGLFTGFSLLSLMEIIYFLTVRIMCNVRLYKVWTGRPEELDSSKNG